jgi:acetyl esterase/lipase
MPVRTLCLYRYTFDLSNVIIDHFTSISPFKMPVSWAAWTTHWYIYFWQFLANRASVGQLEAHVRKSFESENTPEVLSEKITSNTNISVKREVLEAGQEWEVFHVSPKSSESRKRVVIYWHGGAFIRRVSAPFHLAFDLSQFTDS